MEHRCLELAELAALLDVPPDDPRRASVAACPRCDSLLRAGAAFLAGDDALSAGERARAEQVLAATLAARLGAEDSGVPAGERPAGSARTARARVRSRRRAGWGWGLGLAAVLAGTMILTVRDPGFPAGPTGVLRGGTSTAGAEAGLLVTVAGPAADGTVRLTWPAVAGAVAYRIELYTAALDTVAVLVSSGPSVSVGADLAARQGEGAPVLCRIRASGPDGELAVSPLRDVRLR